MVQLRTSKKAEHKNGPSCPVGHPTWRGCWLVRRRRAATIRQARPAATRHQDGTLARRDAAGWCARGHGRQRPSGKERGKSASGSARRRRTLTARSRGRVRLPQSRSIAAARQDRPCAMRSAPPGRDAGSGSVKQAPADGDAFYVRPCACASMSGLVSATPLMLRSHREGVGGCPDRRHRRDPRKHEGQSGSVASPQARPMRRPSPICGRSRVCAQSAVVAH